MSPGDDRAVVPAPDAGGAEARPAGLLEKLVAAVRPEFRADVFIPDPADLVFGGQACRVDGCGRPGRARGLCHGHHRRWSDAGKPDIIEFTAATEARIRGRSPLLPCRVSGCGYGRRRQGLVLAPRTGLARGRPAGAAGVGRARCRRFTSRSRLPAAGSAFASCGRKVRPGCAARTGCGGGSWAGRTWPGSPAVTTATGFPRTSAST